MTAASNGDNNSDNIGDKRTYDDGSWRDDHNMRTADSKTTTPT